MKDLELMHKEMKKNIQEIQENNWKTCNKVQKKQPGDNSTDTIWQWT